MKRRNHIYLDHAAGTFLLPEARETIQDYLFDHRANPSSIHSMGRQAAAQLDGARQEIAYILDCKVAEIIFTSGGTEANNLAIRGLVQAHPHAGRHIISCGTEHPSVLESLHQLVTEGYRVTYLTPNTNGEINLDDLQASTCSETCLISLMWVNNETGLVHPIEDIARIAQSKGIPFHCDAVQALGHFPIRVDDIQVDALSLSGHKIGAPAGLGVLYLRKGSNLKQQSHGGSQEHKQRGGTQNSLGALAFARAMRYHSDHFVANQQHIHDLQQQLQASLSVIPGIQFNRGASTYSPHILNCSFQQVDGEALFIRLDMSNISVSNGSACSSGSQTPSHVLLALGLDEALAQASLRISLGVQTTQTDIDYFCHELQQIIHSIRRDSA